MERKTRFACRCRPFRGLALALFALFGGLATAAQAMLLTLDLRWGWGESAQPFYTKNDKGEITAYNYNLQEGSIIQVIGYKYGKEGTAGWQPDAMYQFGDENYNPYGTWTGDDMGGAPYDPDDSDHAPENGNVWLADNTQTGHEILYTGTIQDKGSWYGLYTQITVDSFLYDTVYIRVFGATSIEQGEVTASYWGVSAPQTLTPSYATATFATNNVIAVTNNYFEVIPEPATLGLLGVGGIALAAWRRHRFARTAGDALEREED